MALVVGTDTWITLAEAETYFAKRPKTEPWDSLDDPTKESWLFLSYQWIINDPAFEAPASSTATGVKYGQAEGALFLINSYDDYAMRDTLISSGVERFEYSKWKEDLGSLSKPLWVRQPFQDEGFFNGGIVGINLCDPSTLT